MKHDVDDWLCVLKLARLWQFDKLYERATEQLPYDKVPKSAVEKVALAFDYDLREWLVPGLNDLARRPEPMTKKDVELLGIECALKVAAVRETIVMTSVRGGDGSHHYGLRPRRQIYSGTRNAAGVDFTHAIKRVFDLEDVSSPTTTTTTTPSACWTETVESPDGAGLPDQRSFNVVFGVPCET